jgi:hypothetical protein
MGEPIKKWEPKRPDYASEKPVDVEERRKETMEKLHEGGVGSVAKKYAEKLENEGIVRISRPNEREIKSVGDSLEEAYQDFFVNYQQIKMMKEKVGSGELSVEKFKELQAVASEELESFMRSTPDHGIEELRDKVSKINNLHKALIELGAGLEK